MKSRLFLAFCLASAGALAACKSSGAPSQSQTPAASSATAASPAPAAASGALMDPSMDTAQAPAVFKADFDTTKGKFVIEVHRDWAPLGADRFYNLVKIGYYNGAPFFRVIKGFMVQFGINADPAVNAKWIDAKIPDDPSAGHSNTRGMVTFATAGPNTRTTQVFINYADNASLDSQGFVPFGQVTAGMDVVDNLNGQYGEGAPMGQGPDQQRLQQEGAAYTKASFPGLDYVNSASIEP